MPLRSFPASLLVKAALLLLLSVGSSFAKTPALNVVFFLVDDLGWRDTACYGSEFYETPNIDQLAREGVRFTQAYSAHPRCVPARYAFLTGKYPARAGVPGRSYNLEPKEVTVAEALKEGGYATFFAGKWHLSKEPEQLPERQGFDINVAGGAAGAPISYFYPYNKLREKGHQTKAKIEGLDEGVEGEYLTDRLTDETIAFIKSHCQNHPTQPFFTYVSHYAVHTPLEAKDDLKKHYRKKLKGMTLGEEEYATKDGTTKLRQDNPVYAAMVHSMDESLGRITETLESLGVADRTVIIFTSDHGGLSNRGVQNKRVLATSNLPLRAGKGHCYEGGIRVPLIVKWPSVTKPGSTSEAVITGTDHFPTILQVAGLALRPDDHMDGVSYVEALQGREWSREQPLFWHSPKGRPNQTGDNNCTVIREGDWKLLDFYDEKRRELYNLKADPYEQNDQSMEQSDLAQKLLSKVENWRQETAA